MPSICRLVPFALALAPGCFAPAEATRGLPCTDDDACAPLTCSYGVCGGPVRCEAGAGVGDYCFTLDEREFEVGAGIDALAVGTVDFDALPDLVVGNGAAGNLALLRNVGGGDFAAPVLSGPLGAAATEIAIGSVDGMQWSDAVVTTDASSLVLVPLVPDTGAGAFESPAVLAAGIPGAARPKIGQFVDDPNVLPDVAALVADGFDVVPQVERGVFGDLVHTELASSADLRTFGADASRVYVASESGSSVVGHARATGGAFTATTTIDVGPSPVRFVLEDLDGDTFGDVLSAGATGKLWLTTGRDATFADPRSPIEVYDLGWQPSTLLALNLDDDRDPEYLVSGAAPGGRRDVYLFDNDGEGRPVYGGSFGVDDASAVALADIDLDGVAEILIASQDRGTIRVARRAVAPPPPGGEESSGTTKGGSDPSSPTDPSDPTDPSITDPSVTDPTFGETGVPVDCEIYAGALCFEVLAVADFGAPVVDLTVAFLGEALTSVVVVTDDGLVWNVSGLDSDTFTPAMPLFQAGGVPSGLAVGPFPGADDGIDVAIAVSHDAGLSTYSVADGVVVAESPIEGGARAPLIDVFPIGDLWGESAIAVAGASGGLYVATGTSLADGMPPFMANTTAAVLDLDLGYSDEVGSTLMASGGGPIEVFMFDGAIAPLTTIDGAYDYVGALYGTQFTTLASANAGQILVQLFQGTDATLVDTEQADVISDFQLGEFDGVPGFDVAVMVAREDGGAAVRMYGNRDDGTIVELGDIALPGLRAFVPHFSPQPLTDLIVAFETEDGIPVIVQLRPTFFMP